jgi:hypothetical protein
MRFLPGSIPESVIKKIKNLQCYQHLLKVTTPNVYKKYMASQKLNNFIIFFTKLFTKIDPCGKRINILGGHAIVTYLYVL